jgi:hypothetical protein
VSTGERDRVAILAKSNHASALQAARLIASPFMRSQSLAWVARFAPTAGEVLDVAREVEKALESAQDDWEAIAGVAWAVRALAERGREGDGDAMLLRAVRASNRVENPVRRIDALFLLIQAGWTAAGRGWHAAVETLVESAGTAKSGKAEAVQRDLVLMLAGAGRDYTTALAGLAEGKAKRQVLRRLSAKEFMVPRPFFW